MSGYENDIVILLRKICALSLSEEFDATEDIERQIIIKKLKLHKEELYKTVNDFLTSFDSRNFILSDYQLKIKAADIWKMQKDMFEEILLEKAKTLKKACKDIGFSIEYELDKLLK